jgi:hypothetical protein
LSVAGVDRQKDTSALLGVAIAPAMRNIPTTDKPAFFNIFIALMN